MIKNKVVVIDSGLSEQYISSHPVKIFLGRNFCGFGKDSNIDDGTGHGTSIVNIIFTMHKECEFVILKIYNESLQQDVDVFLRALQYVLDLDITDSIIHMSVGIDFYCQELHSVCQKISEKNNVLMSSYDNAGCISYPAVLECVIGVEGNALCAKSSDFVIDQNSIVEVYAKGGNHRVLGKNGESVIRQGNSYSAAFVTGFLAKSRLDCYSKKCALETLEKGSTFHGRTNRNDNNYFDERLRLTTENKREIKKIGVFPYNKEIAGVVRYAKYLSFQLVEVFSCKYLKNVGSKIVDKDGDISYTIQNIEHINFENIDTLVIGHISQLEFYIPGIKEEILTKCLKNGINVYSLDTDMLDGYMVKFCHAGLWLRCPTVQRGRLRKNGKLYQISVPIIGIFGTSEKQGKFSLQLELKHQLESKQYSVGFLSSEPTGELFGADRVVPYGYEGMRHIADYEFIDLVNTQLHEIELLGKEIIVTGAQSRTIPQSFMNLGVMAVKQLEYMLAVQPDAVFLCVNYGDEEDYILRTINVIENLMETKVLGLVLFPLGYKSAWNRQKDKAEEIPYDKLAETKERLRSAMGRKVYIAGEETSEICDDIIKYF